MAGERSSDRTFAAACALVLLLWSLGVGAKVMPSLIDSWALGGPGARHAVDVEISREQMRLTGSVRR